MPCHARGGAYTFLYNIQDYDNVHFTISLLLRDIQLLVRFGLQPFAIEI